LKIFGQRLRSSLLFSFAAAGFVSDETAAAVRQCPQSGATLSASHQCRMVFPFGPFFGSDRPRKKNLGPKVGNRLFFFWIEFLKIKKIRRGFIQWNTGARLSVSVNETNRMRFLLLFFKKKTRQMRKMGGTGARTDGTEFRGHLFCRWLWWKIDIHHLTGDSAPLVTNCSFFFAQNKIIQITFHWTLHWRRCLNIEIQGILSMQLTWSFLIKSNKWIHHSIALETHYPRSFELNLIQWILRQQIRSMREGKGKLTLPTSPFETIMWPNNCSNRVHFNRQNVELFKRYKTI
jgi:hypothetical protein